MKYLCLISLLFVMGCSESVEPVKVEGHEKKAFEKNAIDAAGVAQGDEQVSPNGRPAY